ncbi:MAG: hypothetical protein J3Q66DRAFT_406850 [Benniella sp.]|nr:MAG: hypothetical protein J3Q66DRAFT_406850 [Benniella sp.]
MVHLADHPGYELGNQNELIEQYGSCLLPMMHMVKYGVRSGGLVIPPLLELNHATRIDMGQEYLQFVKDTSRLVDDTITHFKEATGVIYSETAVNQKVDNTELMSQKSHLKVEDEESLSDDPNRMSQQNNWVKSPSRQGEGCHRCTGEDGESTGTLEGESARRKKEWMRDRKQSVRIWVKNEEPTISWLMLNQFKVEEITNGVYHYVGPSMIFFRRI